MELMRVLILTLILTLVAQPLQAGGCAAMDQVQDASTGVSLPIDSGMDGEDHDCCDTGTSEPTGGCEGTTCCPCLAVAAPLPLDPSITHAKPDSSVPALLDGRVPPSHSAPLFRPPIS